MIYTVTLNPALDKTVQISEMTIDRVNRISSMRTDPGGKGINVSKVIQKLGGSSIAIGILGGSTGQKIQTALYAMDIKSDFLFSDGETRTNLKIVDPVLHTNTDVNEPGLTVSAEILEELLQKLCEKLTAEDIVILSGSLPKGAPRDTYKVWGNTCRKTGAKVILDADGDLLAVGLEASPYMIKPNNHEISRLFGKTLDSPQELCDVARALMKQYSIEKAVVSMGSAGALYVTKDRTIYAEGLKVPVGSTVGAGDSVVAALAFAEERGFSLEETVRLSAATGAANVMSSGTQAAEYSLIQSLIPRVIFHEL